MRVPNTVLFDLQTIMDSDFSPGEASGSGSVDPDFGFAFDDSNFSDRLLRIEIMPDLPETKSDGDGCSSIADWARNRKRRREDFKKENDSPSDIGLKLNSFQIGNDTIYCNESSGNVDCSKTLRVKTIHISSPILAAKSPFFYKLFSNGTKESEQRHVTLRIHDSGKQWKPLTDAAKRFLAAARYKDITKFQEEVLNLPLAGIEAVFSSDDLQKAEKVLTCIDFDPELTSKVVLEAIFFKAETPYRQRALAAEEASTAHCRFVERAYKYRPVKGLFPGISSRWTSVFLVCSLQHGPAKLIPLLWAIFGMQERGSVTFTVDYELAARSKPTEDYVSKYKGNYTFTGGKAVGYQNLFGIPWTAFTADDGIYFINGILHIRAELTIRQ
ncbi:light-response BTB 2, POZ/BTB containin G-protein 1 [Hibiscus trionum]|uniref:Light-response BTB 2, POZ/BTB containin G-protein 1 n=1 Tax=Hibiscus trionum TaxID=183268 RepID=A0A9W7J2H1_HIBTR|nr:light-response BTB 2, POZ/BTB containin G-protein 1 [Hibiscus trionum]